MNSGDSERTNAKLAEIERLIGIFKEKFEAGTSDANNFLTMTEIELLWSELQNRTNNIYSNMIRELMSSVDERELIRKKKENMTIPLKHPVLTVEIQQWLGGDDRKGIFRSGGG